MLPSSFISLLTGFSSSRVIELRGLVSYCVGWSLPPAPWHMGLSSKRSCFIRVCEPRKQQEKYGRVEVKVKVPCDLWKWHPITSAFLCSLEASVEVHLTLKGRWQHDGISETRSLGMSSWKPPFTSIIFSYLNISWTWWFALPLKISWGGSEG